MIQSARLNLRQLEQRDLPRFPEYLNDWDVTKWLVRVPFPYSMSDAKWFYDKIRNDILIGTAFFYVVADKQSDELMGVVGFHQHGDKQSPFEIGYWLGKPHWGKGIMSEALIALLPEVLASPNIQKLVAFTDPENKASQNVLRKAGLAYLGIVTRKDEGQLRGSNEITLWKIER